MSRESIVQIYDESLKILNPDYVPGGTEAEFFIWIVHHDFPIDLVGVQNLTFFKELQTMTDKEVIEILKTPWNKIPVVNGFAIKIVPYVFSETIVQWIAENWESLPMSSRDYLMNRCRVEGDTNQSLKEAIKSILEKEVNQNA